MASWINRASWTGLLLLAVTGFMSVDYGTHYDEPRLVNSVHQTLQTGRPLPGWYNYPSFSYSLALAAAAPEAMSALRAENETAARAASNRVLDDSFSLRLRRVFFAFAVLSGLGVALLLASLGFELGWCALGALVVVASPEFFTHARWVAPDALLATAVVMCMWCQSRFLRSAPDVSRSWMVAGAICAGVCVGIKYTGGIVIVPLVVAIVLVGRQEAGRSGGVSRPTSDLALSAICVTAAFIATTPGFLVEPTKFWSDVEQELLHYGRGHWGYSVGAGPEHLAKMLVYLGFQGMSRVPVFSVLVAALSVLGAWRLLRRDLGLGVWLTSLPVAYIVYMSVQSVMFVRNYLLLLPIIAVLAVVGSQALCERMGRRGRLAVVLSLGALLAINLTTIAHDAYRITRPLPPPTPQQLAEVLEEASGDGEVWISPALRGVLAPFSETIESAIGDLETAELIVFCTGEISESRLVPANRLGRYRTIWAPHGEVNWDYYPTWSGSTRVVAVSGSDREVKRALRTVDGSRASPVEEVCWGGTQGS